MNTSTVDPVKLEMFVTAKDCGSLDKAALLLKKAPLEISQAITTLEDDIGAKLFAKRDSNLHLSCEGQMLYLHALDILDSWYITQAIINQLQYAN